MLINHIVVAQNVGVGTSNPTAKLHVNGTLKVVDGSQGDGKILTSNAAGLASWQQPPLPAWENDPSVSICCQRWMTRNLNVSTYRNGDAIPKVTDAAQWAALTTGAYCYAFNDSATYAAVYGKLYNWYAVTDPRGLAPEGWYIPSDFEWGTLTSCLGGVSEAGGVMKETGTSHWIPPNTDAYNHSGFTALPGGFRDHDGTFVNLGSDGFFWSYTEYNTEDGYNRYLTTYNNDFNRSITFKTDGHSVRCIR